MQDGGVSYPVFDKTGATINPGCLYGKLNQTCAELTGCASAELCDMSTVALSVKQRITDLFVSSGVLCIHGALESGGLSVRQMLAER